METLTIRQFAATEAAQYLPSLALLLEDVVAAGASVGFLHPMAAGEADAYWQGVFHKIGQPEHRLFGAFRDDILVGTAQLYLESRRNGAHRVEISKVLVRPDARRQGVGTALMQALEQVARDEARTLLVLDTRTGDDAERLYARLGFHVAGVIPGYARSSGGGFDGSTFMYKLLDSG